MCKHCDGSESIFNSRKHVIGVDGDIGIDVYFSDGKLNIDAFTQCYRCNHIGWKDALIEINFCPMCGTPLGGVKPLTVEQLKQNMKKRLSLQNGYTKEEKSKTKEFLTQLNFNDN